MTTRKCSALAAALAVALLFSGCSSKKKPAAPPVPPAEGPGSSLNGTTWLLETLRGQTAKPGCTVNFDQGQARGSAGCNSYLGPYLEGEKGKFHLELAVMTKQQCEPPEIMRQEQQFVEAVQAAASFTAAGDKLIWQDAKGATVAVFNKQNQELRGTAWQLLRCSNGQGGMTEVFSKGRALTAVFSADGQFSGFGGCNQYLANYTAPSSTRAFSFEMILMDTKQCPPDTLMEQEGNFMAALYAAASYRIEGDTLTLSDTEGKTEAVFRRN